MKRKAITAILLSSSSILALGATNLAFAQDKAAGSGSSETVVVITGSRLVKNGAKAPTPVTVLTTDELLKRAPSNIPDGLNQLPQFQGSNSPAQTNIANPTVATVGNNLNLRNLGAVRALTLFDGERLPPSSGSGLVDADLVPQMLVQRVDVVTGGASAAYGSDAVSGVVNFVLDKRFHGVSYTLQAGASQRGDDRSKRIGLAAGESFLDGKLHLEGSAEYYENGGIDKLSDRAIGAARYVVAGQSGGTAVGGTATNPYITIAGASSTNISFDGYFLNGPLANKMINSSGAVVSVSGTPAGSGLCINCNTGYHDPSTVTLIPTLTTKQVFGRADYALNETINFHAQGIYSTYDSTFNATTPTIRAGAASQLSIFNNNAYLPTAAAAALAAFPQSAFSIQAIGLGIQRGKVDTTTSFLSFGLDGKLGDSGWGWDLNYSYGKSQQDYSISNPDNVRLRASADAVKDPSGNIVCRVTLTNPGLYPGCVPINLFGSSSPSAAAIAYVNGVSSQRSINDQSEIALNVRGDLFQLPAGSVSVAVGAEYRKQTLKQTSNSDPLAPVTSTGIRGFVGGEFVTSNFGNGAGEVSVKEAYGEIQVPILKDVFLAKSLDLNGAYRTTNYSTSGGVDSWKIGGNWTLVKGLRFRATKSRDIRAPTLYELYSGRTSSSTILTDPHTSTTLATLSISGGNPALKPEIANTFTGGVVFQPDSVPGLTVSLDYYDIKITDAIAAPFSLTQIVQRCETSSGTDSICSLISRPLPYSNTTSANFPTSVQVVAVNVASIQTSGYDFELGYSHSLGNGTLKFRGLATFLNTYDQVQAPGAAVTHLAGNSDINDRFGGLPKFRGTLSINYQNGLFDASIQERMIGSSIRSLVAYYVDNKVPARNYTDLNLAYSFNKTLTGYLNVANLFDTQPPIIASSAGPALIYPTYRSLYDVVGRAFTIGVRGRF